MNLEDHAGDVVRKARQMAGIELSEAAESMAWDADRLSRFEDTGQGEERADFGRLAARIRLHPERLRRVMAGWVPPAPDLAAWPGFKVFTTSGRGMAVHSYLVWDTSTLEAALFDTGFEMREALDFVQSKRLRPGHLFITHSHHDHIAAMEEVRGRFPGVRVHSNAQGAPAEVRVRSGEVFLCGGLRIEARDTPGHAVDGMTYVVSGFGPDSPPIAVVGDAIFAGSMGGAREHGDLARRKVREQILSLASSTLICPGHGPLTTVGLERQNNPFFAE